MTYDTTESSESIRPAIEEQLPLDYKERELNLRREELETKRHNDKIVRLTGIFSLLGTVIVALIAFGANIAIQNGQAKSTLNVEREHERAQLIITMLAPNDDKKRSTNILWLIQAGLIDDPSGKIAEAAKHPASIPQISSSNSAPSILLPVFHGRPFRRTDKIRVEFDKLFSKQDEKKLGSNQSYLANYCRFCFMVLPVHADDFVEWFEKNSPSTKHDFLIGMKEAVLSKSFRALANQQIDKVNPNLEITPDSDLLSDDVLIQAAQWRVY